MMVLAMTSFRRDKPWKLDEVAEIFRSTAPKYLDMPGLVRKQYFVTESGDRAGGLYLWMSRAAAEACYTDEWKATVAAKYGARPEITYMHVPVTVDNVAHTILA